jgi:hypothetical protein
MSYDISIGKLNLNYTSNVVPMWDKVMPLLNMRDMNGKKGSECRLHLKEGILRMAKYRSDFELLEPANGWGSFGGALAILVLLEEESRLCPDEIMSVHN